MSSDFTIGSRNYKVGKMDAMTQFHVVRRLAPILDSLRDVLSKADGFSIDALSPIADVIAKMSDADSEYIIGSCMAVTTREEAGGRGWANIWSLTAKRPMFDDIDMGTMLHVTFHVIMDSIAPFSSALPSRSIDATTA
jgi:hypothetical protein